MLLDYYRELSSLQFYMYVYVQHTYIWNESDSPEYPLPISVSFYTSLAVRGFHGPLLFSFAVTLECPTIIAVR